MKKATLAFSGGFDMTVRVPILEEGYGHDEAVGVTVGVDQSEEEFEEVYETAGTPGLEYHVVDVRQEFTQLRSDSVCANVDYQGYPFSTAFTRPVIVKAILKLVEEQDCDGIVHGRTGKGNDQLRFEAVWRVSDLGVTAPVRETGMTREWEIRYATEKDLPAQGGNEGVWFIDTDPWSRSIEGSSFEDPGYIPLESTYEWTDQPSDETGFIEIAFEDGYPVAVDDEEFEPLELISFLNEKVGEHGVGCTDMMEDRMLGLKVRENYEYPAATTLLNTYKALERLVLTKEERDFKATVDNEWSQKAYEDLIGAPLVGALNAFLEKTQERVTGTVTIKFEGGQARPVGRGSEYAAHSESAASLNAETADGTEQADTTGVTKCRGFQTRPANQSAKKRKPELAADGDNDE